MNMAMKNLKAILKINKMRKIDEIKSWGCLNDGSERFKEVIIKFLNKMYFNMFDGVNVHYYYGISKHNNPISALNTTDFNRILTIDEVEELSKEEVELKEGDEVLVRNNEKDNWEKTSRIYLFTDKNGINHCVGYSEEENYTLGKICSVMQWRYIKPLSIEEKKLKDQLKQEVEKLEKEYKVKINVKFE